MTTNSAPSAKTIRMVASLQYLLMRTAHHDDFRMTTDNHFPVEYTQIRQTLKDQGLLDWPLPRFLVGCDTLTKFWEHIRVYSNEPRKRALLVAEAFTPFWQTIPEDSLPEGIVELDQHLGFMRRAKSGDWTGRPDLAQQIALVRSLAPVALDGLQRLIEERERELAETRPKPIDAETLANLRALHAAVGELCRLAEAGQDLSAALKKVKALADKTLVVGKDVGRLTIAGAASILPTWAVVATLERMLGEPIDGTGAAAIAAVLTGIAAKQLSDRRKSPK